MMKSVNRNGKHWTAEELNKLCKMLHNNRSIDHKKVINRLAKALGRTDGAISITLSRIDMMLNGQLYDSDYQTKGCAKLHKAMVQEGLNPIPFDQLAPLTRAADRPNRYSTNIGSTQYFNGSLDFTRRSVLNGKSKKYQAEAFIAFRKSMGASTDLSVASAIRYLSGWINQNSGYENPKQYVAEFCKLHRIA